MDIRIDTNLAELPVWINSQVIKQMKFATSVALYDTAVEAQDAIRKDLKNKFTIRNGYVAKGIRINPKTSSAIKKTSQELNGMYVAVGTVDDFMARQNSGGEKKPRSGVHIGVPERDTPDQITRPKNFPGRIMKKPGYFIWCYDKRKYNASNNSSYLHYGIFKRMSKKRLPIKLVYKMVQSVKIPARWELLSVVDKEIKRQYYGNFERAFEHALSTAKMPRDATSHALSG